MNHGLSGWLGQPRPDAADVLARMAAAAGASSRGAAHAAGGLNGDSRHRDGSLVLAWTGELDPGAFARRFRESPERALSCSEQGGAVAVFDLERRELVLAIDRFGLETLYYFRVPGGVVFGSSPAALRAHPDVTARLDPQSIFNYVYFHMVPAPRGIFQGFERLEPGEMLVARDGDLKRRRYWTPFYDARSATESALADEYRQTARQAVSRCLSHANGKVGAFLSGGTDSSTVTGLLGELSGEAPNTYSIGFDVPGYDESSYATIAVRHFGARHHQYVVTPDDLLKAMPRLANAYAEPFGNASAVASYYCARLAKDDGVETLLAGDGGDEIFAGNERYAKQKVFERYFLLPGPVRRGVVEPALRMLPESTNGLLRKARSYVAQANVPLPDRLESYNLLNRLTVARVFSEDFLAAVRPDEPPQLLRRTYAEAPTSSVLNRLLYLDLKFTLADNDLRKVRQTCDLAGVNVRFPFLDPALVDFANGIPPALKLKGRTLRYFFKRASRGFLPEEILTKKKHGFGVPCGRWMRDHAPLRELAYDSLASLDRRGYLAPGFVEDLTRHHQGEHGDYYGVMVWVLTMLELWHQEHAP